MFYNPFLTKHGDNHLIVYPSKGLEQVMDRSDQLAIVNHISDLYQFQIDELGKPVDFHIVVPWEHMGEVMTDVVAYSMLGEWDSGPLKNTYVFKGQQRVRDMGDGCGNADVLLGAEQIHLWSRDDDVAAYIKPPRPVLPSRISMGEDFYQPE
jgi:hypothetical protein